MSRKAHSEQEAAERRQQMSYIVMFENKTQYVGPYDSESEIDELRCFPQRTELHDPERYIVVRQITKPVCEVQETITGDIAKRIP